MHHLTLSLSLALVSLAGGSTLLAMEQPDNTPRQSAPAIMNEMCPMCDNAIGATPATTRITVGEGESAKSYLVACDRQGCADAFVQDPAPVLKKVFGKGAPGPKTLYK